MSQTTTPTTFAFRVSCRYHAVSDKAAECRHELSSTNYALYAEGGNLVQSLPGYKATPDLRIVAQSHSCITAKGGSMTRVECIMLIESSCPFADLVRETLAESIVIEDKPACDANEAWESAGVSITLA
jgi:hypothetical protein